MSETDTFTLTPIFNEMVNGLGPDHPIWDLNPAAVLDTGEYTLILGDLLDPAEEENDKEEENLT